MFAHPEIDSEYLKPIRECYREIGRSISDAIDVVYSSWVISSDAHNKRDIGAITFKLLEHVLDAVFNEAFNSADAPDDSPDTPFLVALQRFEQFANGVCHRLALPSFAGFYWNYCAQKAIEGLCAFRWCMYLLSKRIGELDELYRTNGRADIIDGTACDMKADWRLASEKRLEKDEQGHSPDIVDKLKYCEGIFSALMAETPCAMNAFEATLQRIRLEAA